MSTTTVTLSEQQSDLLEQLKMAGEPTMTHSGSLDTLKANSVLAKDILETMDEWKGSTYNFNSATYNFNSSIR